MQIARSLAIYTVALAIALFTQTGCKENTILNANVAPAVDNIQGDTMSLNVECRTIFFDSLVTSNSFSGIPIIHGLGTVTDPYFGKTNAGIYFQVVPPTSGFTFGTGATIDSAVLILPYSGFTWGDTLLNIKQKITAYRVTEDMSKDSSYYAFTTKAYDKSNPLGSVNVTIDSLSDSVYVGRTYNDSVSGKPPHLRIPLSPTLFTDQIVSQIGQTPLATPADFLNYFKGFYLEADPRSNGAAIPYFYLDGSTDYNTAAVIFYYHVPDDTFTHTASFNYSSAYCAHFNHVARTYRGSMAEGIIGNNTDNPVLLQNLPGCEIDVTISGIQNIPAYSLVNKAQLVLTRSSTASEDVYSPPYRIYPVGIDSVGATYTIADGYPITSTAPLAFIDGVKRDPDANSTQPYYLLNMPREIQAAMKAGKDTLHLHITGTTDFPGAFRLVAGGKNASTAPIRFNVVYSKQ
jgi:hypothetical protein